MGGWSEDWRVMLNSTQDQIKLKLKFELSELRCNVDLILVVVSTFMGGWVVGRLESNA